MNATEIDNKLRDKFRSHKYQLSNSYVYNWESDFFSISSTGYAQEIEVKVSLSDFRADFKKVDKHNLLQAWQNGDRTILVREDDTYRIRYEKKRQLIKNGKRVYDYDKGDYQYVGTGEFVEREIKSWLLDRYMKHELNCQAEHLDCGIRIQNLGNCPNKFWYCCPKGVIPIEEIPEYAGLYYLDNNMRMTVQKKAPFIHKEKQDLTQVLLDKFYWESMNLRRSIKFNEMKQKAVF